MRLLLKPDYSNSHLCQNGSQSGSCDEGSRRALTAQLVKWASAAHQHRDGGCDDQVNVQELRVSEVCLVAVQDEDGGKLDHGVEGHVLEHSKRGDQSTPGRAIVSLTGKDKGQDLPSLTRLGMQEMFGTAEVKGAATLALN